MASTTLNLARIAQRNPGASICYLDEVGDLEDDGGFVCLRCSCAGLPKVVAVFTSLNFYEALGKVIEKALPASAGQPMS